MSIDLAIRFHRNYEAIREHKHDEVIREHKQVSGYVVYYEPPLPVAPLMGSSTKVHGRRYAGYLPAVQQALLTNAEHITSITLYFTERVRTNGKYIDTTGWPHSDLKERAIGWISEFSKEHSIDFKVSE